MNHAPIVRGSGPALTAERLRDVLAYSLETGVFTFLVTRSSRVNVGDVAGHRHSRGYLQIRVDGENHLAHRLAWLHVYGEWPANQIDHIDGCKTNNRIANLRDVTGSVNQQNRRRAMSNNACGFLGVSRDRTRWIACIHIAGKKTHIGSFATPEVAYEAYLAAKRQLHAGCAI